MASWHIFPERLWHILLKVMIDIFHNTLSCSVDAKIQVSWAEKKIKTAFRQSTLHFYTPNGAFEWWWHPEPYCLLPMMREHVNKTSKNYLISVNADGQLSTLSGYSLTETLPPITRSILWNTSQAWACVTFNHPRGNIGIFEQNSPGVASIPNPISNVVSDVVQSTKRQLQ